MTEAQEKRRIMPYVLPSTDDALERLQGALGLGSKGAAIDCLAETFATLSPEACMVIMDACENAKRSLAAADKGATLTPFLTAAAAERRAEYDRVVGLLGALAPERRPASPAEFRKVELADGRYATVPDSWVVGGARGTGTDVNVVELVGGAGRFVPPTAVISDAPFEAMGDEGRSGLARAALKACALLAAEAKDGWVLMSTEEALRADAGELGGRSLLAVHSLRPIELYSGAEPPYGAAIHRGGAEADRAPRNELVSTGKERR